MAENYVQNCKYVEADYFVNKIAKVKAIYLDGLAEGRKELKKENKIMEEIIIGEQQEINELKAQVEQLSNDNHVLKTAFITQSEQIEKMKCCGNCDKNAYCEKEHYGNDKGCEDFELKRMNTEIKSFMGHKLDLNGDIEGAIPTIEVHQKIQNVMKQFAENQNKLILDFCTKLKIDPDVLEKQLKEIQLLKITIKQKDEQIEKMKCCGNCKNCVFKYDDEDLIFECDINGTESYSRLRTCTNWELAE